MKIGDTISLTTEKLVQGGTAIAHSESNTIFIHGALPDEEIIAEITSRRKGIWNGDAIEIVKPSPLRVSPKCPHFGICGGCTWQHIGYDAQLQFKQDIFEETLIRLGNFQNIEIQKIVPSPLEWEYRNKMEFAFIFDDGQILLGLHHRGHYDKLISVAKDCVLINRDIRAMCAQLEKILQNDSILNFETKSGLLCFLTIRRSFADDRILVGITATRTDFNEAILSWLNELSESFPNKIAGAYLTINPVGSASSGELFPLFGSNEIEEKIGEKVFSISATSFFQTNPLGAEKLYNSAKEFAELSGGEHIWDLYCGTGTIGIYLSDGAEKIVGIDENPDAINNAKINAEKNSVRNAVFYEGDVRKVLYKFQNENEITRPDVIVIDPPRAGLAKKVVERIAAFAPKRIVYISCNPATLARDGALFAEQKYSLVRAKPVDMFPQTYHIEGVALFKYDAN